MEKSNYLGWATLDCIGGMMGCGDLGWEREVNLPQEISGGRAVACQDEVAVAVDGDNVGGKGVAMQPASHNCPMERREVSPRAGKRWAVLAVGGRLGSCRST
jgi:hypothetical protein